MPLNSQSILNRMMLRICLLLSVCGELEIGPSAERVELALAFGNPVHVTCELFITDLT